MFSNVLCLVIITVLAGKCLSAKCSSDKKSDIVFLIDGSASVSSEGFQKIKDFIGQFLTLFPVGPSETQIGIMVFGDDAHIEFHLNAHGSAADVTNAIQNIRFPEAGTEVIAAAMRLVRSSMFTGNGRRQNAEGVVILLTDGGSITSPENIVAADELKADGVTIYTAGVSKGPNNVQTEMELLASKVEYFFRVDDFGAFDKLQGPLAVTACNNTGGCLCFNGGSCVPGHTSCQCHPAFTGWSCQYNICSAVYSPCLPHGSCHVNGNDYTCTCDPGFTGNHCDIDIDDCASSSCLNGTCVDGVNWFYCACFPGYTGRFCDEEIDECALNTPCRNGATCHDLIADFRCTCVHGYTDKSCSTDINECASVPCQNNGTCQDRVNDVECQCPVGYYGWFCETATCQPTMADVIFLLDSSISQTEDDFKKQLAFVNQFIDHVVVDERNFRVGVVTFSFKAHLEIGLNDYKDNVTLKEAVNNITFRPGGTLTHLGLDEVTKHVQDILPERLFGKKAKRYVFLLTDGMSTNRQSTLQAAAKLKTNVTKVLAIGIGSEVSQDELLGVASPGDERAPGYVFSVHNFNALYTVIEQLVALTCDECFWNTSSDVTFLLDMRSDISDLDFSQAVDALTYILTDTLNKNFNVTVRLALVSYDDERVQIQRHLTDTATTDSLIQYIQTLTVIRSCDGGSTGSCGSLNINTLDKALHKIEHDIFSESADDTRQIIILLTNGDSRVSRGPGSTLARLKGSGRLVFVVGVGEGFKIESAQGLVSDPAYIFVSRFGETHRNLDLIATEVFYSSCQLSNDF
ncbi:cartilage matrix protein-like [Mya arenaria]|uniref:cartilage matrix protein-like n=1 Tax=Mya arenaria TaxID=6604 RepID=UPI0022E57142|nr:cartilage matrix protein-like [Mya arenaria]